MTIIFGAVIGMLARLVLPGRQTISALMTVVLGMIGALVGLAGFRRIGRAFGMSRMVAFQAPSSPTR